MFLFIVTLLLLLLVKCSKNFNTSNPISQEINKTINDSKKSIEETEPTGEGSKDEEAEKATESNKNNTSSENKSNSSSTSNKNNSNSNKGSSNKPNSGSNNGGSSNKPSPGSNNSNSGNSSSTEKPAHKHSWVNVTKTVNHPAETHQEDVYEDRQVKVKDAWDEKVWVKTLNVCNQCGYSTTSGSAMDEHLLEYGHSSSSKDIYETVHHDAVYETQRVKVGTKSVTDKAAWTETIVTGQKCSFCGETKTN